MLAKQELNINFNQGLDLKTDDKQVPPGRFLSLANSVFTKAGLLQKRNGFGLLTALSDATSQFITTFNGGLTAIGSKLQSLSAGTSLWTNKGNLNLASLSTLPLYRSGNNQSQCDAVVSSNNLVCAVFTDNPASGIAYYYTVLDATTGQVVVNATQLVAQSGNVNASPRVFLLGGYFIILFGTSTNHIQYLAVSIADPTSVSTVTDITSSYVSSSTINYDGIVVGSKLFIAYNTTSGGQAIKVTYLTPTLGSPVSPLAISSAIATMFALAVDNTNPASPTIYCIYYDLASKVGRAVAFDQSLNQAMAATTFFNSSSNSVLNLAATAQSGTVKIFYEMANNYGFGSSIATNFINSNTISLPASSSATGSLGTSSVLIRSVGLASKAILAGTRSYIMTTYSSKTVVNGSSQDEQPSYFLVSDLGNVIAKLAYSNGGGLLTAGLPILTNTANLLQVPYLIKDFIAGANKGTNLAATVPVGSVYSQLGVNLASINLTPSVTSASEIGSTLNISGGKLWAYDGAKPVESNFNVWPDSVIVSTSNAGGALANDTYYYVATYEWADNNGNVYRSAPSIPVKQVTTGSDVSTNTINVPTLRLTDKTNVKIVVYRWALLAQTYYAIKSPAVAPTLNDTTVDSVAIVDTLANASIIGNPILYTTGGVLENIGPPGTNLTALFNNRLWLVDAEDTNLLWFSKQVIESTPVEMSDLLTLYVAPTTGAQGSTGPITALSAMDDKLIVFKKDAIYYVNGVGPDNAGSNNGYSDATFISSVVGCANQNSIIFIPGGLMFQSDKGIWLLGRNLSTSYIGSPVETLTQSALVKSAITVPGTNQVRFTMDSGVTLMYDYFYGQWGTFVNVPAVSSCVYQSLHTYLNSAGQVFQETIGSYLDNTSPVLLSFTTSWLSLAGLQGFERFYQMLMLGQYFTPFKLNVQLATDYNPSIIQSVIVTPDNFTPAWGGDALWGSGTPWGGPPQQFKARVFPSTQKVESFQLQVQEIYDPSLGVQAGAGLTLSGLALTIGIKKGRRTSSASKSFG